MYQLSEDVKNAVAELVEEYPGIVAITQKLGVLTAMYQTNSSDIEINAQQLYVDKLGVYSVEYMIDLIDYYMPVLVEEGMVVDGKLTDLGKHIAEEHLMLLEG